MRLPEIFPAWYWTALFVRSEAIQKLPSGATTSALTSFSTSPAPIEKAGSRAKAGLAPPNSR